MKKSFLIPMILSFIFVLSACGGKTIELYLPDGSVVEVSTKEMTDEQVELIERLAQGEADMMELMNSGLFTQEELTSFGFNEGFRPGGVPNEFIQDFSNISLDELNLDGFTDEQITSVKDIISGEKNIQSVITEGILTQEQLQNSGFLMGGPAGTNAGMTGANRRGGSIGTNSGGNPTGN